MPSHTYDQSLFQRVGMAPLVTILGYYGFNITDNLQQTEWSKMVNIRTVIFNITLCLLGRFLYSHFMFSDTPGLVDVDSKSREADSLCIWILVNYIFLVTTLQYIAGCSAARHYRTFLWNLATAIDQIPCKPARKNFIMIIKGWNVLVIFGTILIPITLSSLSCNVVIETGTFACRSTLLIRIAGIVIITWSTCLLTFSNFNTFLLAALCDVLCQLIDVYMSHVAQCPNPEEIVMWGNARNTIDPSTLTRLHKTHRNLSDLVTSFDRAINKFMIISLIIEIVGILAAQFLQLRSNYFQINRMFHLVPLFLLTWKAIICAEVSDKLKSSLTLRNVPNSIQDFEHHSAEHVNYILYLNEQLISKAELTYGGFFPIRKSFVLTIAVTAITYALVLNGINS